MALPLNTQYILGNTALAQPVKSKLQCTQHGEETKDGGDPHSSVQSMTLSEDHLPSPSRNMGVLPNSPGFGGDLEAAMAGMAAVIAEGHASDSPTR